MADTLPPIAERMKALQAANRRLIAAEKKLKRASVRYTEAVGECTEARRNVKRVLESMQPDLEYGGELPPATVGDDASRG